jgi:hypothetical protein
VREPEHGHLRHFGDLGRQEVSVLIADLRRRALEVDERPAVGRRAAERALQAGITRLPARERQVGGDRRRDDQDGESMWTRRGLRGRSGV